MYCMPYRVLICRSQNIIRTYLLDLIMKYKSYNSFLNSHKRYKWAGYGCQGSESYMFSEPHVFLRLTPVAVSA